MRVLHLTNFYPPHSRGGYEQWCQEVVDGLRTRGHDAFVLTSQFEGADDGTPATTGIYRDLHLEMDFAPVVNSLRFFFRRKARETYNLERLRALNVELAPDCILVWGMWNMHRSIAALAEQLLPGRVAYYMGDYWPTLPRQDRVYWESPARSRLARLFKTPLRAMVTRVMSRDRVETPSFRRLMFPSEFMRDELCRQGISAEVGTIVRGAIDTGMYRRSRVNTETVEPKTLRLLCVSRLSPEKGVETAIEAVSKLVRAPHTAGIRLNIVGSGEREYENRLRRLTRDLSVEEFVTFDGPRGRAAMPDVYRGADVFLFTSIWPEPFGRVLVEAMVSGLVVVGAGTGGAAEILENEKNSLVFAPGNAEALAAQIRRIVDIPGLRRTLGEQARTDALEKYDIGRMTAEIERFLHEMLNEN